MGIVKPKATDLSHLVSNRIGIPDANITELCLNGVDPTDTTGWAIGNGGVLTVENGNFKIENGLAAAGRAIYDIPSVEVGKQYYLTVQNFEASHDSLLLWGGSVIHTFTTDGEIWQGIVTATSAATTLQVRLQPVGTALGDTCYFNNVSIFEWSGEELIPDPDVAFVANIYSEWTAYGASTFEQDGNYTKIICGADPRAVYQYLNQSVVGSLFNNNIIGQKYRCVVRAKSTGTGSIGLAPGVSYEYKALSSEYQAFVWDYTALSATVIVLAFANITQGDILHIEVLSMMKVTGLVAAYNMIPSPDSVLVDISGEGNNGTIIGAGSAGDGMRFRSGQYIDCTDSNSFTFGTEFTFALRARFNLSSYNRVFSKAPTNYQYRFDIDTTGQLEFFAFSNGLAANNNNFSSSFNIIRENQWHNIVLIFNNGTMNMYVDGVSVSVSTSIAGTGWESFTNGADNFQINKYATLTGDTDIVDLQIYNAALNEKFAIAYHNSFQKISQRHSFDDLGVGSTI